MSGSYLEKLLATDAIRRPAITAAIGRLGLPSSSRGLDAGSGAGLQSMLLAQAVGPRGRVTGLDISAEFLAFARERVKEAGLEQRVSFQEGSVADIPFDDDCFDWAWSADLVGYAPMDPMPLLEELARVVRPGGTLAILAWSSERLLPGYPRLEARLGATAPGMAPFSSDMAPSRHFSRTLSRFAELGLADARVETMAGGVHAPLSEEEYKGVEALIEMRWPGAEKELEPDDLDLFKRLTKPESPEFIPLLPDYYAFFTYSMFVGVVL